MQAADVNEDTTYHENNPNASHPSAQREAEQPTHDQINGMQIHEDPLVHRV